MKILFFFLFLSFCLGCKNRQEKENKNSENKEVYLEMRFPIEVDALRKYDKRSLVLKDIADIEYISLETSKETLLSNRLNGVLVSDSLIVVRNQQGSVFVFARRDGRLLQQFNHVGRGPGEYQGITRMTVDFEAGDIYIYDYPLRYKIWVYSMTGEFKRSISVSNPLWINDFINYDKDYLLVHAKMSPTAMQNHKGSFRPYYLMSKQNGELKQLDIEVAEIKNGIMYKSYKVEDRSRMRAVGYSTSPIIRNGDHLYISDFALDTIYSFKDNILQPFIVNTPSLQKMENPCFVGISAKTTSYTFLSVVETKEETMQINRKFVGIDHRTGEIFEPDFHNNPFVETLENYFCNLPSEYIVVPIPALKLVDAYQKGELIGELKEIASHKKEDDNPVLMFIKFRI